MKTNKFLFIIPLTPKKMLTRERKILQGLCFSTLLKQDYTNWSAVVIGDHLPEEVQGSEYFHWLDFEGTKGEKMPKAVNYIIENELDCDYLIRLDDDDIFNPNKLSELKNANFDICVDKQQFFWNAETKQIANKTLYYFANTTIQKREYAFLQWIDIIDKNLKKSFVVDTNHAHVHLYYKDKNILFSNYSSPLYLRSISNSSITAKSADNKNEYINSFGNWRKNNLPDFNFLENGESKINQTFKNKFNNIVVEIRSKMNYNKIVLGKT